jgi:multiple antibiotic resistance protein
MQKFLDSLGIWFEHGANADLNIHHIAKAIVTVLAVINPVVCGSIFLTLTQKLTMAQKRWAAVKAALSILVILAGSALVGLKVLSIFDISLDTFRVVGGMIIAYMGFDMLSGRQTVAQAPQSEGEVGARNSLAPLIMFAAGPGTITAVVTLAAVHTPQGFPIEAFLASIVGAGVTLAVLLFAIEAGSRLNLSAQAIVTRFMGLIVASMGMQFVLEGLKAFLRD